MSTASTGGWVSIVKGNRIPHLDGLGETPLTDRLSELARGASRQLAAYAPLDRRESAVTLSVRTCAVMAIVVAAAMVSGCGAVRDQTIGAPASAPGASSTGPSAFAPAPVQSPTALPGGRSFGPAVLTGIGTTGAEPVIADLDGDGHVDLAVPDPDGHRIVIRDGDGAGHFGPTRYVPVPDLTHPTQPPCSDCPAVRDAPEELAVADLNRDGHLDLLTTTGAGDSVAVLLADGHGGFEAPRRYPLGGASGKILVGDVTGDGAPDVIVGDALLVNDAHGGLLAPRTVPGGGEATALGDLDGDGNLDVVLQGPDRVGDGGPLWALLNDGRGRFTVVPGPPRATPATGPGEAPPPAVVPAWFALGDLDGDGIPDVVMALPYAGDSGQVQIRHGDGRGRFGPPVPLATGGMRPTAVAIGDVNGDGLPDLMVSNRASNEVVVLVGTGGGHFASPVRFPTGGSDPLWVFLRDLNGDGLPDLAVLDENPQEFSSADVSVRLAVHRQ